MSTASIRAAIARIGPVLGLAAVWVLFAALAGASFRTWDNQRLMLLQTAIVGTAAVGATLVIVSGGIDLSVGSAIALCTVVIALLLNAGVPPLVAALGGVLAGAIVGAAIGSMVVGHAGRVVAIVAGVLVAIWTWGALGAASLLAGGATAAALWVSNARSLGPVPLSPFIVTLAMWGALRGLAKGIADNRPIYVEGEPWLLDLMAHSESGLGAVLAPGVWAMLALAAAAAAVLRYTRFGRHVFAIGSNELTARLCGVRVERCKLLIYALASSCAGLAAILQFGYLSMGDPTTAEGYELKVIAAVVIGGASLSGGEGSIVGTLVGALIMTVVDNGCTKLGLQNWVQEIVTGAIIVAAVVVDRVRGRARRSATAGSAG